MARDSSRAGEAAVTATAVAGIRKRGFAVRSLSITRPKSLSGMVVDRLRQAIVNGELPFGSPLSEEGLASAFEVSRTPVRDALSQLQREGLIAILPQRGSFVFTPDEDDIAEVCEYRLMLETRAAALSLRRDPDGLFVALEGEVRAMEAAFAARDARQYSLADWRYHTALFAHCGNRYLRDAYALASGKFAALSTNVTRPFPAQRTVSFNEHRVMLGHVRDRRAEAFERVLTEHIGRTRGVYLQALERGSLTAPSDAESMGMGLGAPTV